MSLETVPRPPIGQLDKGSTTLVAAQGQPMPIAHRLHLPTWKQGGRTFPEMDWDAVALVGLGDGRKLLIVGEMKIYGVRNVSIKVLIGCCCRVLKTPK